MTASVGLRDCSGLVLAGGAGTRMGGQDKGLLAWGTSCLAHHTAQRLTAAGMSVMVSANRNLEQYQAQGLQVLTDRRSGFNGPLAALEAGLYAASSTWLIAVPCDSPFFPDVLPHALYQAVSTIPADATPLEAAYARCGARLQPAFCILSTRVAARLTQFLDQGGRRMTDWWALLTSATVDFEPAMESAFANANTPQDYDALVARLRSQDHPPC